MTSEWIKNLRINGIADLKLSSWWSSSGKSYSEVALLAERSSIGRSLKCNAPITLTNSPKAHTFFGFCFETINHTSIHKQIWWFVKIQQKKNFFYASQKWINQSAT